MKEFSFAVTALALLIKLAGGEPAHDGFYFWKLGHMDGPHTSSKALGISRDGHTAVGKTLVVSNDRAWRCDIDWAISTDDAVPPLYNEVSFDFTLVLFALQFFSVKKCLNVLFSFLCKKILD